MLIDHENKIVVPKAFKVAGSSMQTYFQKNCKGDRFTVFDYHKSFDEIKREFDLDDSYRHIMLIRNPWDYLVSSFFWATRNGECLPGISFKDFIYKPSRFNWKKQSKFWNVDYFSYIKYEDLPESFTNFCEQFNIPGDGTIGHEKRTLGRREYGYYYIRGDVIEYIEEFFQDYINEFGYEF